MCDDDDYEIPSFFESNDFVTKKEHRCSACRQKFPAGTKMTVWDGDWGDGMKCYYFCEVCVFIGSRPDTSKFHGCLSTYPDDPAFYPSKPIWLEVAAALREGREPSEANLPADYERMYGY